MRPRSSFFWILHLFELQKFSKRRAESTDEKFTDSHWSLWLQCICLVYKGFCLWRDWQLMPVWLWISPCVIECWCKMASQEWSLCSLKDLLLNQNVGKNKDTAKQPDIQRSAFSITRCSFTCLKNTASKQNTSKRGEIFIAIVKKDCVDAAFCIWREYPYLLCEWVYGSESPLFLFIVKRSHHLCHSSQHSSISFKTGVNNPAYCAE